MKTKLRCVTVGSRTADVEDLQKFVITSKSILSEKSISVRNYRLITDDKSGDLCNGSGFDWFCVPFYYSREVLNEAYDVIRKQENAFVSIVVNKKVSVKDFTDIGDFIKAVSFLNEDGSANFRVGTSFNTAVNTPFFPFTYHTGPNSFSLACELVPLFIEVENFNDIEKALTEELLSIQRAAFHIENATGMFFKGIDASLAPYPGSSDSVMEILKDMGLSKFGKEGTLYYTNELTSMIKRIMITKNIKAVGFNGVMYSVVEDEYLGKDKFDTNALMLASCVCGCGIDMLPIPGDTSSKRIALVMRDLYALSNRLNKPLGFRVLPIPNKKRGDMTFFTAENGFMYNTPIRII